MFCTCETLTIDKRISSLGKNEQMSKFGESLFVFLKTKTVKLINNEPVKRFIIFADY